MFSKKIKVLVHSGRFHADEVFAISALKILYKNKVKVIRSREIEDYDSFDFVLDTGHVYDHQQKRYDHHQKGGAGERDNGVPYASFGLIWKHYGPSICNSQTVSDIVDRSIVQPIDASDTGYESYTSQNPDLRTYTFDLMIKSLHPIKGSNEDWDDMFEKAVNIASLALDREIKKAKVKEQDMKDVLDTYQKTEDKRVLIFSEQKHLSGVLDDIPETIYTISPETDGKSWKIYAVPREGNNPYVHRKSFPESWAGLENTELEKATGISGAIFCHNGRFLCVTKTKEGAIQLAKKSLEY